MPPYIALAINIIFILIAFRLVWRDRECISYAMWLPTIWMIVIGSRMVSRWFVGYSTDEAAADNLNIYLEGSTIDRTIFIILLLAGLVVLSKRNLALNQLMRENKWYAIFLLYSAISILWSDHIFVSFKRYIKEIVNIVMVLVVLTEVNKIKAIKILARTCSYALLPLSITLYKYFPEYGRQYHRWSGEMTIAGVSVNKNGLGVLCMVCCILLLWNIFEAHKNKKKNTFKESNILYYMDITIALLGIWLLVTINSATALVCTILGIFYLIILNQGIMKVRTLWILVLFVTFSLLIIEYTIGISGIILSILSRDATLTGRTELWKDMLNLCDNKIIGLGYSSFWVPERMLSLWDKHWIRPNEAHNGYLEIVLDLGVVGLVLWLVFLFNSIRNSINLADENSKLGVISSCMMLIIIIYNITESSFRSGQLVYFIYILFAVKINDNMDSNKVSLNGTSVQNRF